MRTLLYGYASRLICIAVSATLLAGGLHAQDIFNAKGTTRESERITGTPAAPRSQLTLPSKDLAFQLLDDGRMFQVFASQDDILDDAPGSARCSNATPQYEVYWLDNASGKQHVCLSVNHVPFQTPTPFDGNSGKPLIGGPADDEGRYVLFETLASNVTTSINPSSSTPEPTPTAGGPTATPTPTPAGPLQQIVVHDRKWEDNDIYRSKCDLYPFGDSYLGNLSDDGRYSAVSSDALGLWNNLSPACGGTYPTFSVYIRNGGDCKKGALGACYNKITNDSYDLHSTTDTVGLLNEDSHNPFVTQDGSFVVFETDSTVPVHFLPDTLNQTDIFSWNGSRFDLLTQIQVPLQSLATGEVSLRNVGGPANGDSGNPRLNSDGTLVVFDHLAVEANKTELVLNPTPSSGTYAYVDPQGKRQIYLLNRNTRRAEVISLAPGGLPGNDDSKNPWISRDGRFIIFESRATNLVTDKTTTAVYNIFLRDRTLSRTFIVTPGDNPSYPLADTRTTLGLTSDAAISYVAKSGLAVAFQTSATNTLQSTSNSALLVPDTNGVQDVFIATSQCPRDSDGDSYPDCLDLCPSDASKNQPGQCGCGIADTDTDSDGTSDCNDLCPADALKTIPGVCGCGLSDVDTDSDGTSDCLDACPFNPDKAASAGCGCGVADTDGDGDGTPDCLDQCVSDPAKSAAGLCGCGNAETDANGNGSPDCVDPNTSTVPPRPNVNQYNVVSSGATVQVTATASYPNSTLRYTFVASQGGKTLKRITSSSPRVLFKNLRIGTAYKFKYRIIAGTVNTRYSPSRSFTPTKRFSGNKVSR